MDDKMQLSAEEKKIPIQSRLDFHLQTLWRLKILDGEDILTVHRIRDCELRAEKGVEGILLDADVCSGALREGIIDTVRLFDEKANQLCSFGVRKTSEFPLTNKFQVHMMSTQCKAGDPVGWGEVLIPLSEISVPSNWLD